MEQAPQPHHRQGMENLLDKTTTQRAETIKQVNDFFDMLDTAHEEGIEDNYAFDMDKVKTPEEKKAAFIERIKPKFSALLTKLLTEDFVRAEGEEGAVMAKQRPIIRTPGSLPWKNLEMSHQEKRFGTYTLNPGTQRLDFDSIPQEKIKVIKISDMPEMRGKNLADVAEFVVSTYGATHYIPGVEYLQFLDQSPAIPESLNGEDKKEKHYLLGSVVVSEDGTANVPQMWVGDVWNEGGRSMGNRPIFKLASLEVNSFRDGGVVLIEK